MAESVLLMVICYATISSVSIVVTFDTDLICSTLLSGCYMLLRVQLLAVEARGYDGSISFFSLCLYWFCPSLCTGLLLRHPQTKLIFRQQT